MLSSLKRPQMGHLPVGGPIDNVAAGLEQPQTEQAIEVRRLFFRRNAEPNMIGIEIIRHGNSPSTHEMFEKPLLAHSEDSIILEPLGRGKVPPSRNAALCRHLY